MTRATIALEQGKGGLMSVEGVEDGFMNDNGTYGSEGRRAVGTACTCGRKDFCATWCGEDQRRTSGEHYDSESCDCVERSRWDELRVEVAQLKSHLDYWQEAYDGMVQRGNQKDAENETLRTRNALLEQVAEKAKAVIDHDCAYCVTSWCDERDNNLTSALQTALSALEPHP